MSLPFWKKSQRNKISGLLHDQLHVIYQTMFISKLWRGTVDLQEFELAANIGFIQQTREGCSCIREVATRDSTMGVLGKNIRRQIGCTCSRFQVADKLQWIWLPTKHLVLVN